jgi:hypothetical protein
VFDPLVSVSAPLHQSTNNNTDANADNSDNPSHFSTPSFNHFPAALIDSQPLPFWPAYESPLIDLPTTWDESAHGFTLLDAARAINAVTELSLATTPITRQPPIPQSPPLPQHHPRLDFDHPSNFYDCPHAPISSSTSASASASASAPSHFAAAAAPTSTARRSVVPSASRQRRQRHHNRATRHNTNNHSTHWDATYNSASPPALNSSSAFALPQSSFGRGITAFNSIFDELEDTPNYPFPFPIAETADTSFSSTSDAMPTPSTARRRTRSQVIAPEAHGDSTSTTHADKRQRVMPSAAEPTSQTTIDDDDDSLFGFSSSRPGSSSGLKDEEYTTIDLTEATDVPEELKKPKVDKRVKVSAFQCVICMDDVTGLTLTHCGKSQLHAVFFPLSCYLTQPAHIIPSFQAIYSVRSVSTPRSTSNRQEANAPCAEPKST